jgi:SAM-dependent methyltransferase
MPGPFRDLEVGELFPPIEEELGPFRHYFTGRVLNAGAGSRDLSGLIDGELFNQDIKEAPHINYNSPLHEIPVEDGFFDAIICNAVLEHVENPHEVMHEFARVSRPGGILYLTVPFMQPEHLDPTDFQRYTLDGLERLVSDHGFEVRESGGVHSVYITLAWIVREWLAPKRGLGGKALKGILYPVLRRRARRSNEFVHSLASAYRVIGVRN